MNWVLLIFNMDGVGVENMLQVPMENQQLCAQAATQITESLNASEGENNIFGDELIRPRVVVGCVQVRN